MVKTSNLAVILAALIISVTFMGEADGAGLVWRAVNKLGSLVSDLGDVAGGCSNGAVLKYQTSNTTWICGTDSTGSGFTNIASMPATTAKILADNSTTTNNAIFKTLTAGTGISLTNNTQDVVITSTVTDTTKVSSSPQTTATLITDNSTSGVTLKTLEQGTGITITNSTQKVTISSSITQGFTNITPAYTSADSSLLVSNSSDSGVFKNLKAGTGISLTNNTQDVTITSTITQGFDNAYPISTSTNSTLIVSNSTNDLILKNISAGAGITIYNGSNTVQINVTSPLVVLAVNQTTTMTSTDYAEVWRIPLTANSGNYIDGQLIATSSALQVGVQTVANVTNANTIGMCIFQTSEGTGTTAPVSDLFSVNASNPSVDTASATNPYGIGYAFPIKFDCSLVTGPTPGDLRIFFQSETGASVSIKAGSYYKHLP